MSLSVYHKSLMLGQKIFLQSLHTKLRLMKNFVKAMGRKNSAGFQYIKTKFPQIRNTKLKERIFAGEQIREPITDVAFNWKLNR